MSVRSLPPGEWIKRHRELKERALRIKKEKLRRRKENGIYYFKPWEDQAPVMKCGSRIILVSGCNRGGKTYLGSALATLGALGKHEPWKGRWPAGEKLRIWIGSDTHDTNRESFVPILEKLVPKDDWNPKYGSHETLIRNTFQKGTEFAFKSYEQGRKAWQGAKVHIVVLNEESPEEIFDEALLRGAGCNGVIIICMTAIKGATWVYRRLWIHRENPKKLKQMGLSIFVLDGEKCPYIAQTERDMLKATLSKQEYDIRVRGLMIHREGKIYDKFTRGVHVRPIEGPPPGARIWEVADPGINTFGVVFAYTDPVGRIMQFDEIYAHDAEISTIQDLIHLRRERWGYTKPYVAKADPAALARQSGKDANLSQIEQLARGPKGVYFDTDVNKSVEDGIYRMREYLTFVEDSNGVPIQGTGPWYFVDPRCEKTIYEFDHYVYDKTDPEKQNDKVKKKHDHLMDCLRYMVMSLPGVSTIMKTPEVGTSIGEIKRIAKSRMRSKGLGKTRVHRRTEFGMRIKPRRGPLANR